MAPVSMDLPASTARVRRIADHVRSCDGGLGDGEHAYEVAVVAQDAAEAAFGAVLDPADAPEARP